KNTSGYLKEALGQMGGKYNFLGDHCLRTASETKRSQKIITIFRKDGSAVPVHQYQRKKRSDRPIGDHAPSELLTILIA
ncbi:MAG: hypothetical protein ACI4WR_08050, partial [Bulleidia sp.]